MLWLDVIPCQLFWIAFVFLAENYITLLICLFRADGRVLGLAYVSVWVWNTE
jgi:uncharacterized RDD family membrane protein YckC